MSRRNQMPPRSRGRARGAKGRKAVVQRIAREKRWVKLDGKSRRVTTVEALLLALVARAAKGDAADWEMLLDLQGKLGDQTISGGYLLVPELISAEDWIAEQMEANKHRKPPLLPDEIAEQCDADAKDVVEVTSPDPLETLTFGDLLKR
jgi:hypothetical protein